MKIGDLVYDHTDNRYGIIVQKEWTSRIGTPFDWLILWCDDGTMFGGDSVYLEVINESR